jgi:hypothetical protein
MAIRYKLALVILCLCWIGSELKHNATEIHNYIVLKRCDSVNEWNIKVNKFNDSLYKSEQKPLFLWD